MQAVKAEGGFDDIFDHQAEAEDLVRHLEHKAEQTHHRQCAAPEGEIVDHKRGIHVAAAAQHAYDHRG